MSLHSHFGQGVFHPRTHYPLYPFADAPAPHAALTDTPLGRSAILNIHGRSYSSYFINLFAPRPDTRPILLPPLSPPLLPPSLPPALYPHIVGPTPHIAPNYYPRPHHPLRHTHYPPAGPTDYPPRDYPQYIPPYTPPYAPPRPPQQPPSMRSGGEYNREAIAGALRGALAGRADQVIATALRHGLNPAFFAAVIMKESNGGSSRAATDGRNNFTGISGSGRPQHLGSTPEQGLEKGAALLAKYLKRHGATTSAISSIARIYAPVGASNDPHGTNGTWPSGVLSFFRRFGGQSALSAQGGPAYAMQKGPSHDYGRSMQETGYGGEEYRTGETASAARRRRQNEPNATPSRMARTMAPQNMGMGRRKPGMGLFGGMDGLFG